MAKKARVYDGTAWQELASAQTDLTAYSTTAQMNTAITDGVGLVPILTQTIGTAVSSVTVNNAFSATYDNYKIIISGGVASADSNLNLTLGASATGYYQGIPICNYGGTTTVLNRNNGTTWAGGYAFTTGININHELANPFLAQNTTIYSYAANLNTAGGAGAGGGFHNVASSFTAFTIASSPGTLTGGTIYVYGYKK